MHKNVHHRSVVVFGCRLEIHKNFNLDGIIKPNKKLFSFVALVKNITLMHSYPTIRSCRKPVSAF